MKNSLNLVKDVSVIYVNFIIIVTVASEKKKEALHFVPPLLDDVVFSVQVGSTLRVLFNKTLLFTHNFKLSNILYYCLRRAFAKLRNQTIFFVISVRTSVRPHGKTRLPLAGFS